MNKSVITPYNRQWFERLVKAFPGKRPVESYLREQAVLRNNKSNYKFSIRETDGPQVATEKRLKLTECFVMLRCGIYLLIEQPNKPGSGILQTYANDFEVAKVTGTNKSPLPPTLSASDLNVLWNGKLKASVEQTTYFEGLDTKRFYKVPGTQQNAINTLSEADYNDGLSNLEPTIIFQGRKTNSVELEIPSYTGIAIESHKVEWETYVVFYAQGFIVPDVTDADVSQAVRLLSSMNQAA